MTISNKTYQAFLMKMGGTRADEFIADPGELFYDPESTELRIGDGVTPGGHLVGGGPTFSSVDYGLYPTNGNKELISPATNKYHLLVDRQGGGRYTVSGTDWNDGDSFTVMTVYGTNPASIEMWFDALQIYIAGSLAYQTRGCAVVPFGDTDTETKSAVTFTWVNGTWHADSTLSVTQVI